MKGSKYIGKATLDILILFACILTCLCGPVSISLKDDTLERGLEKRLTSPAVRHDSPLWTKYNAYRSQLLKDDRDRGIGANITLTAAEKRIDDVIIKEKQRLIDNSRVNRTLFPPSASFKLSKPVLDQTQSLKLIKSMPKGAALHLHDIAIASLDWLVKNVTYRQHVWMCRDKDGDVFLAVFISAPDNPGCTWKLMKEERAKAGNKATFDSDIISNLNYMKVDPVTESNNVHTDWNRFNKYFLQVIQLTFNADIMRDYFRQALTEFYQDGVQYIELRSQLYGYTELDGTVHDAEFGLKLYQSVTEEFKREHPDFIGVGVIMSSLRFNNKSVILQNVKDSIELHKRYPGFFLGYDMVGEEGPNHPLVYYLEELLYPSSLTPPYRLPYFFHAGETNWQGTETDENLFDALLLNTTRIGHGFALSKHPALMDMVKERGVALEVNPISNQVLGLVSDPRNHPAAELIAQGFPVVISSDDPGAWGSLPLSHDLMVTLLTLCGRGDGLAVLKHLAKNSLIYSAMSDQTKQAAVTKWTAAWDKWVGDVQEDLDGMLTDIYEPSSHKGIAPPDPTPPAVRRLDDDANNGSQPACAGRLMSLLLVMLALLANLCGLCD